MRTTTPQSWRRLRPRFAHHLRLAGYRTVLSGKMHFVGADQLHGFEERLITDVYPADFGWTSSWEGRDSGEEYLRLALDEVRNAGVVETSMQLEYDEAVVAATVDRIARAGRSGDGRPLFLVASFTHPHDPFVITREYWDRYEGVVIDKPEVGPVPVAERDPHSALLAKTLGFDQTPLSDEEITRARRAYYGEISYLDDKVGQILDALGEAGMLDDTVIVFTSDHGEMLGERGQWFKMSFFEGSVRVPLIVSGRGVREQRIAAPASLVDLLPTLLEISGGDLDAVGDLPGRSLAPWLSGAPPKEGEVIAEYLAEGAVSPLVMVRWGSYKYIAALDEPHLLYDLERDPRELSDVAGDGAYREVVETFQREVSARWDLRRLRDDVIFSQRRRRIVFSALTTGAYQPWDHDDGSGSRFVRNVEPDGQ